MGAAGATGFVSTGASTACDTITVRGTPLEVTVSMTRGGAVVVGGSAVGVDKTDDEDDRDVLEIVDDESTEEDAEDELNDEEEEEEEIVEDEERAEVEEVEGRILLDVLDVDNAKEDEEVADVWEAVSAPPKPPTALVTPPTTLLTTEPTPSTTPPMPSTTPPTTPPRPRPCLCTKRSTAGASITIR